jgi:uncharacterized phage-associated protein
MLTCHNVAEYLLSQVDDDAGDLISNLKLQKLVYYSQGFSLALNDEPIFAEDIEAWMHGPVVPDLYHAYKGHGSGAIPRPQDVDFEIYSTDMRDLLDEVYTVYGQFSAWKLRSMTHDEPPWKETPNLGVISHVKMKDYFKTQLV